jgi:ribonuclease HI
MSTDLHYTIWTDGGARNNPGPAGVGAVIATGSLTEYDAAAVVSTISEYIGQTTNNQAEYKAMIVGLEWLTNYLTEREQPLNTVKVSLITDSELMAYQIQGRYKVKNGDLQPLHGRAISLLQAFAGYAITPVRREKNQIADKLVNQAIDSAIATASH